MKKIITIAMLIASTQASAFWNDNNGQYNSDGRFSNNGYGYSDGNVNTDGRGSADGEANFSMSFKGRGRSDAKSRMNGYQSRNVYGNSSMYGRGYGYNQPYYYGYAPVAPLPHAPHTATGQ